MQRQETKVKQKQSEKEENLKINLENGKLKKKLINQLESGNKEFEWRNFINTINRVPKYLSKIIPSKKPDMDSLKLLFDESKNITTEEVQEMIARVIAAEINEPNTVSRKAIRILNSMSKSDYELFRKYLSLFWSGFFAKEYFEITRLSEFQNDGFNYNELQLLQSLSLINST